MQLNKLKNNNGIGLIEVIAALGVATVVTTSLVALSVFTLRSSLRSKLLMEGSKYSSQQMELLRAARDKNTWTDFVNTLKSNKCVNLNTTDKVKIKCTVSTDGVISSISNPLDTYNSLAADKVLTGFYLTTDIVDIPQTVNVLVVSMWRDGNQDKISSLRSDFTNWQNR